MESHCLPRIAQRPGQPRDRCRQVPHLDGRRHRHPAWPAYRIPPLPLPQKEGGLINSATRENHNAKINYPTLKAMIEASSPDV